MCRCIALATRSLSKRYTLRIKDHVQTEGWFFFFENCSVTAPPLRVSGRWVGGWVSQILGEAKLTPPPPPVSLSYALASL